MTMVPFRQRCAVVYSCTPIAPLLLWCCGPAGTYVDSMWKIRIDVEMQIVHLSFQITPRGNRSSDVGFRLELRTHCNWMGELKFNIATKLYIVNYATLQMKIILRARGQC